jgi:parvulin-like peptidyl-prolyl isomerase
MSITGMRRTFQKRLRPIFWFLTIVFGVGMVAYFGTGRMGGGPGATSGGRDDVVLKVNGIEFKHSLFDAMYTREQASRSQQYGVQDWFESIPGQAFLRQQVGEQFLDLAVDVAAAKAEGVRVGKRDVRRESEARVQAALEKQRPTNREGKALSDRDWDAVLRRQGRTLNGIREELRGQLINEDLIRDELIQRRLQDRVTAGLKIDAKKIDDYFASIEAHQIVVSAVGKRSPDQAEARAKEIRGKIAAGGDFVELAKEFSDDPGAKTTGGSMGALTFQATGTMDDALRAQLYGLKPGEVSQPVKTAQGYVILRVDKYTVNKPQDWKDKKRQAQYRKDIEDAYKSQLIRARQDEERKKSKIERVSAELKAYGLMREWGELRSQGKEEEAKKKLTQVVTQLELALSEAARFTERRGGGEYMQPQFNWMLAEIYSMLGEKENQIKAVENVLRYADTLEVNQQLAGLYEEAGEKKKAIERYRAIVPIAWDRPDVLRSAAQHLLELGDKKWAAKAIKDAEEREAEQAEMEKRYRQLQEEQAKQKAGQGGPNQGQGTKQGGG